MIAGLGLGKKEGTFTRTMRENVTNRDPISWYIILMVPGRGGP